MKIMFASIRDMRKRGTKNLTSAEMNRVGYKMQRLSFMAELEFSYIYALNCRYVTTGESSPLF